MTLTRRACRPERIALGAVELERARAAAPRAVLPARADDHDLLRVLRPVCPHPLLAVGRARHLVPPLVLRRGLRHRVFLRLERVVLAAALRALAAAALLLLLRL